MRRHLKVLASMIILVGASACSRGHRGGSASYATRDSSGITIIESLRPKLARSWSLSEPPEIEIGVTEGPAPYEFDHVNGAVRLMDGRIAVADFGTEDIRFFDSTGAFLKASGREGAGPGEYEGLQWMWKGQGDSLLVLDGRLFRVTVIDPSGSYARVIRLGDSGGKGLPAPFGSTQGGDMIATSGSGDGVSFGQDGWIGGGDTIYWLRFSGDGQFENVVAALPASPHWGFTYAGMYVPNYPPFSVGWRPFAWNASRVFVGLGGTPEVQVFSPEGTLERLIRWHGEHPRPVTDKLKEQLRAHTVANATSPQWKTFYERWASAVPFPDSLPVYQSMKTDADGDLWVEHFRPEWEHVASWSVFDSTGVWLTDVTTPADFKISDIGTSYVLGVHRDTIGVEQVRMYQLLKPGG